MSDDTDLPVPPIEEPPAPDPLEAFGRDIVDPLALRIARLEMEIYELRTTVHELAVLANLKELT